jgi:hypothetical protein
MEVFTNTSFGCIALLRGARNLAVQPRTISISALHAPSTALQNFVFLKTSKC